MLSQTVEYAMRAIVHLADHHGEAQTTEAIAATTKVPVGYLAKIMLALAKSGLVSSQRGLGGGFTLNSKPSEVTLFDIVQAIDPIRRITACPLDLPGHSGDLCPLHRRLDNALLAVETSFRKTTIAQLLVEPATNRPLCEFPRSKERRPPTRA